MSLGVITIDDAGIAFASASGSRDHSPGYAVLDGRELRFGAQAMAHARLDPRRSFDRFWEQLDQQPLPRPAGPAHSHADLAYFHLHALWQAQQSEADEVLLAVSAGFEADQLALLVGIAKACGIPVAGLVAAPVTAAATLSAAGPYLLLQAGIHRMQAAAVWCDNGLGLGERRSVVRRGLAELNQQWASMVAKAFVHDSRFDPLQAGVSEQALYDRLPQWLAAASEGGSVALELASARRSHRTELVAQAFIDAAQDVYAPLVAAAAGTATVVVDHHLAGLPGLCERLQAASGTAPEILAVDAAARGALAWAQAIRSDGQAPAYVTRLPRSAQDPWPAASSLGETPTHLLHGWRAYPISASMALPVVGDAAGRLIAHDHAVFLRPHQAGLRVNGAVVGREVALAAGDCIDVGGETMRLIVAAASHGEA